MPRLSTQALKGERATIYDRNGEGWAWGQLDSDGYVGWLPDRALAKPHAAPTHKVTALRTFAFPGPSIKLPPVETLVDGRIAHGNRARTARSPSRARAGICRSSISARSAACREGFCRGRRTLRRHALSLGRQEQPRHRLLRPRPGRAECRRHRLSARQRHAAGRVSARTSTRSEANKLQRGDLIFWKGHVAIARDATTIVHANAHHMATVIENTARRHRTDQGRGQRDHRDQAVELNLTAFGPKKALQLPATAPPVAASSRNAAANSARV